MSIRAAALSDRSRAALTPGIQYFLGIEYNNLEKLCNICGLQSRYNPHTTPEAHREFLQTYQSIFIQPTTVLPMIPELIVNRHYKKSSIAESVSDGHGHMKKLLDRKAMEYIPVHFQKKIKILIKILKKLPFHRSHSERLNTYKILRLFPAVNSQFTDEELKQLSDQIMMESWVKGSTVYGDLAFYMILKGYARPHTMVGDKHKVEYHDFWYEKSPELLTCGDGFGTLSTNSHQKSNNNILSVTTEERCEIIKISRGQYEHVKMDLMLRDQSVKEELIQACPFYQQWPKLSVNKLVELIKWKNFPENHVIVKEGEISSFAGYIKSGYCYIFKDIEILKKLSLGKMQSVVKHIIMGKLQEKESFGEISIILKKPFTCSIISATKVELGVISAADLQGLDSVNKILLQQTAQPILGNLTQEEVNNRYISLEKKKEWQQFKQTVINQTISYKGIRPGFGKWKHDWNKKDRPKGKATQSF
ncbi:cyclic nucleotide-binding domain-containing protein 1 [Scyliorhinus canicula]|uniref:cyclic nucleotide-binding domain-containing protein 1 n=1 Tax=Scyliorhinus canicula TaxID=7830 RepID=UPI0018F47FA6|nr:cyclic nucleotide-binding domain-containing protein 1 [Scyliorhinus canicula]